MESKTGTIFGWASFLASLTRTFHCQFEEGFDCIKNWVEFNFINSP